MAEIPGEFLYWDHLDTLREAAQVSLVTMVKAAPRSGEDGRMLCKAHANAVVPEPDLPLAQRLQAELEHRIHLGCTRRLSYRASTRSSIEPRGRAARAGSHATWAIEPPSISRSSS